MGGAVQRILIPYTPRGQFLPYHERTQRWGAIVAHRRFGKTVGCINDLVKRAVECKLPDARAAYVAPFYAQAKDIAWGYLKRYTAPIPGVVPHEAELRVDFPWGARIRLYGADNYNRMRGIYLDDVVLDEPADMDPRAWPEVIRPALSDRQGRATFIGTPKGRNGFWEIWEAALRDPAWFTMMLKASETGILPEEELADARRMMTAEQYAQEYECSFDAAIVGAYYGREIADAEAAGRVCDVPYERDLPVYTAWDLGMGDSTAIWIFQVGRDGLRVLDCYENHGFALDHYVSVLNAKGYKYECDFVPHDAKVRELGTGRTRVEILKSLGRNPKLVPDHKLMDGINAARVSFGAIWFNEATTRHALEALRQYRRDFDERTKAFKDTPRHDWTSHFADAFRYMAMSWRELKAEAPRQQKPRELVYTATSSGRLVTNMTVPEIIEMRRKKRLANG